MNAMSIWIALILITLCALLWDIGIVLQKLAVDRVPRIRLDRSFPAALLSLVQSGRWMAGLAASAIGWGLFALALAFTPVSVARAIQGSGFVILAVLSLIFLRHRLSAREWIGVALVTSGIVALGFADSSSGSVQGEVSLGRLEPAVAACLLACAAAYALPNMLRIGLPRVIAFSIIAGTLLGLGDVTTKVLLELLQRHRFGFPAASAGAGLIVFYVSGFLVLSRAYQHGRAILVTAVSDLCSRLVAIFIGVVALGEALAGDPRLRVLAVLGYAGILVGAVFLARFSGEELADGLVKSRASRRHKGLQALDQSHEGEHAEPAQIDADD
jgi:drug/metabolite transporter (DMT)-like permease